MFADGRPYTSKLEEATIMFREPMEVSTATTARMNPRTLTAVMKAYENLDCGNA